MDAKAAMDALARALAPLRDRVRLDEDDLGCAIVFVRRDLTHLDADALNDRLHAWAARVAHHQVPGSSAFVSFRHARPATLHDAELDIEEEWHDLEPTFRLELHLPTITMRDVDRFATLVPEFLDVVGAEGRPEGWRDVEAGNAE